MNEEAIIDRLDDYHRSIVIGISEIRRHCGGAGPRSSDLDIARARLSTASKARSRFVSEEVVRFLLKDADTDLRVELSELQVAFTAKRSISDNHVTKWTVASIEADWRGYCSAARDIWAMMETQIERERRVFVERLRLRSADKKRAGESRPGQLLGEDA